MVMFRPYGQNDLLLAMMETLVRDGDWAPVQAAFESTKGDFTAKFVVALEARFAQLVPPEVFIDVPERPEELRKADLDALVRPVAEGFLRSYPSKDELVSQAHQIRRRQDRRPPWIPRLDMDGNRIPMPKTEESSGRTHPARPLTITALSELGEVPVLLPAEDWERPELAMMPGGIGEWGAALHAVLGLTHERGPATTVRLGTLTLTRPWFRKARGGGRGGGSAAVRRGGSGRGERVAGRCMRSRAWSVSPARCTVTCCA
ncbi:hypothetical protein GCM10009736_26140 [Actinomadura bangladeshensis]